MKRIRTIAGLVAVMFVAPSTPADAQSSPDPFGNTAEDNPFGSKVADPRSGITSVKADAVSSYPSITAESVTAQAARERLERKLGDLVSFVFFDQPLLDVVHSISKQHTIPIVLDSTALEEYGIGTNTPVNTRLESVSIRAGLRQLLNDVGDLTYFIDDEVLVITTVEQAESRLITRVYQVSELLPSTSGHGVVYGDEAQRCRTLVQLITSITAPESWDHVGGPGGIRPVPHLELLVISQTHDVLLQVEYLLAAIRDAAQNKRQATATHADLGSHRLMLKVYKVFVPIERESVSDGHLSIGANRFAQPRDYLAQFGNNVEAPQEQHGEAHADRVRHALHERRKNAPNPAELAEFIPQVIQPTAWKDPGSGIRALGDSIVVCQTERVHEQVCRFLLNVGALRPRTDDENTFFLYKLFR